MNTGSKTVEAADLSNTLKAQIVGKLARYCIELHTLDLIGVRRKDVARLLSEATGTEVNTARLHHWDCGAPVPEQFRFPLHRLAWHAHDLGMETLLEVGREHPDLVATVGFRRFLKRLATVRELLLTVRHDEHSKS
jgi:hypothetical protein